MSRVLVAAAAAAGLVSACAKPTPQPFQHRLEVHAVTGNTVQFIPAADQLPYCLIFTQSEKGVTRQMTMTQSNQSVTCPKGEPVLGQRFRIPVDEGTVHVRVLFSDQRLQAAEVAEQVVSMSDPAFDPINLRLPGRVLFDSVDYVPLEEAPPVVGEILRHSADGGPFTMKR
jgi:hypothetical protein